MEVVFHGHACLGFEGRSATGHHVRVLTDPYRSGALNGRIAFAPVTEEADVVTVSHWHVDHGHVTPAIGAPTVVESTRRVDAYGLDVTVRPTFHDRVGGTRMGMVGMVAFELDGLRVAHLGDIGCDVTPEDARALGPVDVLVWPVGGVYTLGPDDAAQVLEALQPRVALPVHYEHARCRLGLATLDEALAALAGAAPVAAVTRPAASRWTSVDGLPAPGTVVALEPLG